MTAEEKLALKRLSILELAEALGNVSEACRRQASVAPSSTSTSVAFRPTEWKGSRTAPGVYMSRSMTTPPGVVDRILELSLEHPAWAVAGCPTTCPGVDRGELPHHFQKILKRHDMGTPYER
jgi:hypothetical protein